MRGIWIAGTAVLLAGCVSTPDLGGTMGAPSFTSLQEMCGGQALDYGKDAQSVYSTLFDAYVGSGRGKGSKDAYCAFQTELAQHYAAQGASSDAHMRDQWVSYLTSQRAKALSWRATVDPSLRGG
ncbi:hypothetical protein [Paraburkholderia saeva]|uniref:Lipoprotein n=1 Tax=Paraburkholderia saeva TaxID=2777537 RepID=A0A9N8RU56_9BURK|nr:hypothetical protein [Paraburkholderia saeva]CAG4890715.1 hypothetical protein LMG31841_01199 [Paraburkholderia saeva]CAG4914121.1 hypothetical protein R70241_04202 [Paraburkholderia saeva]